MPKNYLSFEKITTFSQLFSHFDFKSVGTINMKCLRDILCSMAVEITDNEVEVLLNDVGNENSNAVKLDEFLAIMSLVTEDKELNKETESIFNIFDVDKNQTINSDDIKKALNQLDIAFNDKEIKNMLQTSNKGSLNLSEFEWYMFKKV